MRKVTRQRVHPGEVLLKDYLRPLDMPVIQLADKIGVPCDRLLNIVYRRAPIDYEIARELAKEFDATHEFWLNLQRNYDASVG